MASFLRPPQTCCRRRLAAAQRAASASALKLPAAGSPPQGAAPGPGAGACSASSAYFAYAPGATAGAPGAAAGAAVGATTGAAARGVLGGGPWAAFLLMSPTRSSLAGAARREQLEGLVSWYNGEGSGPAGDEGPEETALLRPWRLAETVACSSPEAARRAAWRTSRASGFRARLGVLRSHLGGLREAEKGASDSDVDLSWEMGLDGLTYVAVEVQHPADPGRRATVRALVDTGSTGCDLQQGLIDQLGLPAAGDGYAQFETAAGRTMESRLYRAVVRVMGRETAVSLTPSDEEEDAAGGSDNGGDLDDVDRVFGFGASTDQAILGSEALAALGLLVDCGRRRLLPPPADADSLPSVLFRLKGRGPCVPVEVANPARPGQRAVVEALVDTGSTDVDLDPRLIQILGLVPDPEEAAAQFETSGGVTIESPIYWALARTAGREASVRASPSEVPFGGREEDSADSDSCDSDDSMAGGGGAGGAGTNHDEALLGHDALANLGLLVDCRGRRLLAAPPALAPLQGSGGVGGAARDAERPSFERR